jgi:hypothetical protein
MNQWIRNNLKSEQGSTMIMALSVILTLTTFATISLMTSVANIQMSGKYRDWSKDYYTLDKNAELRVNTINNLLEKAENCAQIYMNRQYYLSNPLSITVNPLDNPNNDQDISNALGNTSTAAINYMYSNWQAQDAFKRLYYYYASSILDYEKNNISGQQKYIINYLNNDTLIDYQSALFSNDNNVLTEGSLAVTIDTDDSTDTTDPPYIDPATVNKKQVSVTLNVMFPTYQNLPNKVICQGNPVFTNAITASGSIGFTSGSSPTTINGDLFSADKDQFQVNSDVFYNNRDATPLLNDNDLNNYGIYSSDGANVVINGNVYSRGNLHINGSSSGISVHPYSKSLTTITTALKNDVFYNDTTNILNNNLFFDYVTLKNNGYMTPVFDPQNPDLPTSDDYIQGIMPTTESYIPLVYDDVSGGNVYCNSLAVDGNVNNGAISVDGNVTTFNDIKMNGGSSNITVGNPTGNFIGINATAIAGDPNASSTVINNNPPNGSNGSTASEITLNGKFIVPGTAYAEYSGYKGYEDSASSNYDTITPRRYYQTGESITASSTSIFGAYMTPVPTSILNDSANPWYNVFSQYNFVPDQFLDSQTDPPYDYDYNLLRGETSDSSVQNLTTLAVACTTTDAALTLADVSVLPDAPNVFTLGYDTANPETVYYTSINNVTNQVTVQRGFQDTARNWPSGTKCGNYTDNPEAKWLRLAENLQGQTINIKQTVNTNINMNINSGSNVEGYSLGGVLLQGKTIYGPQITNLDSSFQPQSIANFIANENAYEDFNESLFNVFVSKTWNIGTADKLANNFDGVFVNNSVVSNPGISSIPSANPTFVYLKSTVDSNGNVPATLNLSNTGIEGIIYCEGDLNIIGNNSFDGAIICNGTVTISGHPIITYNESVIKTVLLSDVNARLFFAPGAMGSDISTSSTVYQGAAYRSNGIHYKIAEWKEGQQP